MFKFSSLSVYKVISFSDYVPTCCDLVVTPGYTNFKGSIGLIERIVLSAISEKAYNTKDFHNKNSSLFCFLKTNSRFNFVFRYSKFSCFTFPNLQDSLYCQCYLCKLLSP